MTNNIRDRIKDILGTDRYAEGYEAGVNDTLTALSDYVREQTWGAEGTSAGESVLRGAKQALAHVRRRRKRRGLTPAETRILDFVAANPGCTMGDIRGTGIRSTGTVYSLVARRKLVRREDPKPHLEGKPWVHFYPMEPRNG